MELADWLIFTQNILFRLSIALLPTFMPIGFVFHLLYSFALTEKSPGESSCQSLLKRFLQILILEFRNLTADNNFLYN